MNRWIPVLAALGLVRGVQLALARAEAQRNPCVAFCAAPPARPRRRDPRA